MSNRLPTVVLRTLKERRVRLGAPAVGAVSQGVQVGWPRMQRSLRCAWRQSWTESHRMMHALWRHGRPVAVLVSLCFAVACVLAPVAGYLSGVFLLAGVSALLTFAALERRPIRTGIVGWPPSTSL